MTRRVERALIWIASSFAVLVALLLFVAYWIGGGIRATVEHNRGHRTTATVVSVAEIPGKPPSDKDSNDQLFKVCFTLDNFNDIEANMRRGYQSAEERRVATQGPRCESTIKGTLAKRLSKGDKVEVTYLLENDYQIDVAKVTAYGEDL